MTTVTITLEPDDPDQPTLVYRTQNMELRGALDTLDGVAGAKYVLTWFEPVFDAEKFINEQGERGSDIDT